MAFSGATTRSGGKRTNGKHTKQEGDKKQEIGGGGEKKKKSNLPNFLFYPKCSHSAKTSVLLSSTSYAGNKMALVFVLGSRCSRFIVLCACGIILLYCDYIFTPGYICCNGPFVF